MDRRGREKIEAAASAVQEVEDAVAAGTEVTGRRKSVPTIATIPSRASNDTRHGRGAPPSLSVTPG